jgi:hypothetical protein
VLVGKAKPSEAIQVFAGGHSLLPAGHRAQPADLSPARPCGVSWKGLRACIRGS